MKLSALLPQVTICRLTLTGKIRDRMPDAPTNLLNQGRPKDDLRAAMWSILDLFRTDDRGVRR